MSVKYGVFDDQLTEGWGIILMGCTRAHYYRGDLTQAICGQSVKGWRYDPQTDELIRGPSRHPADRLRRSRGLKTDCKRCRRLLEQGR